MQMLAPAGSEMTNTTVKKQNGLVIWLVDIFLINLRVGLNK